MESWLLASVNCLWRSRPSFGARRTPCIVAPTTSGIDIPSHTSTFLPEPFLLGAWLKLAWPFVCHGSGLLRALQRTYRPPFPGTTNKKSAGDYLVPSFFFIEGKVENTRRRRRKSRGKSGRGGTVSFFFLHSLLLLCTCLSILVFPPCEKGE